MMTSTVANVVPADAAFEVRDFVFTKRDQEAIKPQEAVTCLLTRRFGVEFQAAVRNRRLHKWVLQVFKRLKKHGWLEAPREGDWPTTMALKACPSQNLLARRVPDRVRTQPSAQTAPEQALRPAPEPTIESWGEYVQSWVFDHRQAGFCDGELAASMVQKGYGTGPTPVRLMSARDFAQDALQKLAQEGLLELDSEADVWEPTEMLREWPTAN